MISRKFCRISTYFFILIHLLLLNTCEVFAQDTSAVNHIETTSSSFWSKKNISSFAAGGISVGILGYAYGVWWKNDYRSFHFFNEPQGVFDAHLGIDKVGHFYTSYAMYHAIYDLLKWGEHPDETSFWWATGISAFHALAIEIGDGVSQYGFDYEDLIANWSGVAYCVLQEQVPFLKNFQFKWSLYYPLNKHSFKVNDLYDYHIYSISAKVNNLLPESVDKYWPDFLQIAFGYSGRNNVTQREFILTLDYDLEQIPIEGNFVKMLKSILNLIHLPAPGIKFSPANKPEFHLLLLN